MASAFLEHLNAGKVYGSGNYTSCSGGTGGCTSTRPLTSSEIKRMSKDISAGYSDDMENIFKYANKGEVAKAIEKYQNLDSDVDASVETYGHPVTEGNKRTIKSNAYQGNTDEDLATLLCEKTTNPFMTGVIEQLPVYGWFFHDGISDDEVLERLSGDEPNIKSQAMEYAGAIAGGLATGAVIGTFIPIPGIGTGIGAALGAVFGILKCATS